MNPQYRRSWPKAIIHLDADAFFASCEQAVHPELKGRPVVTGKERGIVSAASYEAKAFGVKRGVALWDVPKMCPDVTILPSDYETYSLFSKRIFEIMRRYTSDVEEYSIDEGFAEITGLRRPLKGSYREIAERMKEDAESELGIGVSVGVTPTKTLSKIASDYDKPSGCIAVSGREIEGLLREIEVGDVWGIGPATTERCKRLGIHTANDFAQKPWSYIEAHFTKPHQETWHELNGRSVLNVETELKSSYASIGKTKTFTPPSRDKDYVWGQLVKNLENACIKARRYKLVAKTVSLHLKTQDFRYQHRSIELVRPSAYPLELNKIARELFDEIYRSGAEYRATGVVLGELREENTLQLSLFEKSTTVGKMQRIYSAVDKVSEKMGKHTLHIGASLSANKDSGQRRERGNVAERKLSRLQGESARKHLRIPLIMDKKV